MYLFHERFKVSLFKTDRGAHALGQFGPELLLALLLQLPELLGLLRLLFGCNRFFFHYLGISLFCVHNVWRDFIVDNDFLESDRKMERKGGKKQQEKSQMKTQITNSTGSGFFGSGFFASSFFGSGFFAADFFLVGMPVGYAFGAVSGGDRYRNKM